MEKYLNHIKTINNHINEFSEYLRDKKIPTLKEEISLPDYLILPEIDLDAYGWPNGNAKGVYFLFGKQENDDNKIGLYIGKASIAIGHRLSAHLTPFKRERNYSKNGPYGQAFRLELATSVPLEDEIAFFAVALEEYLINKARATDITLLTF